MSTSIQHETCANHVVEDWQPRPALAEALERIATIADGDETAVITDREISFQNAGERTTISATPINVTTFDGLTITDIVKIRTPLTSFKYFDEENYSLINVFATTGAVVREADGEDVIITRLPLFEGDDEVLAELYTPLIANGARLQTLGPRSGLHCAEGRREEFDAATVGLPHWDEPSYWGADDFAHALERLENNGIYANAGVDGLTAEFDWEPGAVSAAAGHCTSLLEVRADVPHPAAGNGLFYCLRLPLNLGDDEASRLAAKLNRVEAESIDTPPFFGAWCAWPGTGTLSFGGFWPNLLYRFGTAANIAYWCWARNRFARQALGNAS
jgi:hypothetical protein